MILGKPRSRGRLTLASPDVREQARLDPAYFEDPVDMETMVRGVELARKIGSAEPLTEWGSTELTPGKRSASRAKVAKWIAKNAMTTYHFAGTCRMGDRDDRLSVVDPECRVIGVEALRVADSSIFPEITNGNLNAPSIMVGEKASDHILGRAPLPGASLEPWFHPQWQTEQR